MLMFNRLLSYNVGGPEQLTPTVVIYRTDLSGLRSRPSQNCPLVSRFANAQHPSSRSTDLVLHKENDVPKPLQTGPLTETFSADNNAQRSAAETTASSNQGPNASITAPRVPPSATNGPPGTDDRAGGTSANTTMHAPDEPSISVTDTLTDGVADASNGAASAIISHVADTSVQDSVSGTKRAIEGDAVTAAPPAKRGRNTRTDSGATRT